MQLGQPLNKPYLERLTQHLKDGAYSKSAMTKRMAVARRLLLYLQERVIAPEAATVADEQGFLDYKLKKYSERHGHRPNDASAWRWSHTSGIHMLLRLVQGNWPPVPAPATHREAFHVDLVTIMHSGFPRYVGWHPVRFQIDAQRRSVFLNLWEKEVAEIRFQPLRLLISTTTSTTGLHKYAELRANIWLFAFADSYATFTLMRLSTAIWRAAS